MRTMRIASIRSRHELRARPAFAVTIMATLGLCFGTLAAAMLPARRVARLDPTLALRGDP